MKTLKYLSLVIISTYVLLFLFASVKYPERLLGLEDSFTAQVAGTLENGLVAYYQFDGNATDSGPKGLNGEVNGPENYTSGKLGQALLLNGDNYVEISGKGLQLKRNYTYSFWLNLASTQNAWAGISSKTTDGSTQQLDIQFNSAGDTLRLDHGTDTGTDTSVSLSALTGGWHHLVVTFGNQKAKIYIDGSLQQTLPMPVTTVTGNGPLYLGREEAGITLKGAMDEVRIYSRPLSVAEVSALYNYNGSIVIPPPPPPPDEPVACTSFTYSNWSDCVNGSQTRTVTSSSPSGCEGGFPVLSQTCTLPTCTYNDLSWSNCVNSSQTRTLTAQNQLCTGEITKVETQSCVMPVEITMTPADSSILTGQTLQLNTTVTGTTNTGVTYTIIPIETIIDNFYGTITATGLYTAPNQAVNITVQARSKADNTKTANANVSVRLGTIPNTNTAYYPFTGNLNNSWNSNWNGTCTNCPTLTSDRAGASQKAYAFNGSQSVSVGDLDQVNNFSLSFWMKPSTFPSANDWQSLVIKPNDYGCELDQGNTLACYTGNGSGWEAATRASNLSANTWYHVVSVYNGDTLSLYLNGNLITTAQGSHTSNNSSLLLGSWEGNREYFSGSLDEVRIYNTALSLSEIIALYGSTPEPTPTTCSSFTYSAWTPTTCTTGTQTRTVTASTPTGCTGGTPVLSQSCTVTPPASTKFSLNTRVQVSSGPVNVRATASTAGTLLGTQALNVIGTVIGGPTNANSYNWWNVNFDSGVDGWVVETYLQAASASGTVVDAYQDMEGSLTSGYGAGTWSVTGAVQVSNLNEKALRGPVTVGSTTYNDIGSTHTWRVPDNVDNAVATYTFDSPKPAVVLSGYVTVGPAGGNWEIYDYAHVHLGAGYAVFQLNSGGAGVLQFNIETGWNGTKHTAYFPVNQNQTYWYTFKVNGAAGTVALNVYEIVNWTLVGSVTGNVDVNNITHIGYGVGSPHNNTSPTYTYFDDILIDYTNLTFPLLPSGTTLSGGTIGGIPIENAPTAIWAGAGIPGGIPLRETICSTLSPGVTATDIQNAITSCPSGQVVKLNPGIYNISSLSIRSKDNWVLRGSGMSSTILNITPSGSDLMTIGQAPPWDGSWTNTTNITGATTQGATSVAVASSAGYAIGDMCVIDMNNAGWIQGYGTGGGTTATYNNDAVGKLRDGNRAQLHYCKVTGVTGSVISFTPALPYTLELARTPQITKLGVRGPQMSGIEDMTVNGNGGNTSDRGITVIGTYGFWLKNVEVKNWGGLAAVWVRKSANFEMRGSYLHDPDYYAVDHGYGLQLDPTSNSLIVDNIIYNTQSTMLIQGGSDSNVIAYNAFAFGKYVNGGYTGEWLQHEINGNHSPFPSYNLFEGNYTGFFQSDYYYGPSGWGTLFRNRIPGNSAATTQHRIAVSIDALQRNYSVVGNQLGERTAPPSITLSLPNVTRSYAQPGSISWSYDPGSTNFSYTTPYIYRLGYPYSGRNDSSSGTAVHDSIVKTTTLLHGNWDAANNAVVWDPAVADRALPDSLFLTSKPSWFGSLAWPAYGPNAPSNTVSDLAKIPAGYRLLYGISQP